MTRKDTILIAVVINAGLLAILFTTAVIYDTDGNNEQIVFDTPLVDNKVPSSEPAPSLVAVASTGDEVDNVLKYYTTPSTTQPIVVQSETYINEPMTLQTNAADDEESSESVEVVSPSSNSQSSQERFTEVTVKKGDVLEKIAKANKTTIGAIKRANNLSSERLSIGQVLKIPVKQNASTLASEPKAEVKSEVKPEVKKEVKSATAEPVYYTIKSGDNPWKVAKQFGVKYDEILRLNSMDEDKARNLKIGDRIRVK